MKFRPSGSELAITRATGLSRGATPLRELADVLNVSGSAGQTHLKALRIVPLDNVDIDRILPTRFLPKNDSTVFSSLCDDLLAPTEDQLKRWATCSNDFRHNKFISFFDGLAISMTTATLSLAGSTSGPSPCQSESSSGEENSLENSSRETLHEFMKAILRDLEAERQQHIVGGQYKSIKVKTNDIHLKISLGPPDLLLRPINTRTDGGLIMMGHASGTGSDRPSEIVLVSFESKRRHAGGHHRAAGQPETTNPNTLGQEVAHLLGAAMEQDDKLEDDQLDQEAFLITIHGTQVRIIAAFFSSEYISYVKSDILPTHQHVWVRRSKIFDLKHPSDRKMALRVIIGMVKYLYSGLAEMNELRLVAQEFRNVSSSS